VFERPHAQKLIADDNPMSKDSLPPPVGQAMLHVHFMGCHPYCLSGKADFGAAQW
jgi:hypothetical protein